MTNIGLRPSVEEKKGVNLESYLFGNPGGVFTAKAARSAFYHFHRAEQKFESLDLLVEQLKQDRATAEYFVIAVNFWRARSTGL